ncbi:MAG: ribosome biogenesis GTPase YlqF [Spirochaetales bacterium]|nr:ribosome biogenesis GTPase YlqF [Spirochaetales bacterium]
MQVQWFPGHMTKAGRQIKENQKKVDIIIEILDARVPLSSRNPLLRKITAHKKRIILLNKDDLADPRATKQWLEYFRKEEGAIALAVSAQNKKSLSRITPAAKQLCAGARWMDRRPVRAMILGIPNVGKSTLINAMAGNKKAGVANMPGFTKDMQRYEAGKGLQIFDTPGMLWPKFEDMHSGFNLAALGSIKDTILPIERIALFTIPYLCLRYSSELKKRYKWEELPEDPVLFVEELGRKRGCIVSGGAIDREKACYLLLRELRDGKIGRISLERPGEERKVNGDEKEL